MNFEPNKLTSGEFVLMKGLFLFSTVDQIETKYKLLGTRTGSPYAARPLFPKRKIGAKGFTNGIIDPVKKSNENVF